jgi:hypothetical protein
MGPSSVVELHPFIEGLLGCLQVAESRVLAEELSPNAAVEPFDAPMFVKPRRVECFW